MVIRQSPRVRANSEWRVPGFKLVLMMPDGLATTHDPAGHNLPQDTPAMLSTILDGILDPTDRPGIRNSVSPRRIRGASCSIGSTSTRTTTTTTTTTNRTLFLGSVECTGDAFERYPTNG
ncbi:hypothetical protein HZH66_002119 [Vespula vulgaris]|uniref:Uncharacterized protein n=1 Tax=Vespula vulgaris TaxID=7454 RepID=A0A834NFN2_VESVU|nr:hypothetical protein HZH66_002119 [Vespula vulgaris]